MVLNLAGHVHFAFQSLPCKFLQLEAFQPCGHIVEVTPKIA